MTFTTFVDILASRAINQPTQRAFTFLTDGELENPVHLTYGQLDKRARQTADLVRASVETVGQPVLLLFPPGLDIVAALFGCFYAGAIAIIADFPRRRSSLSPVDAIVIDAGVTVGLTSCLDDIEPYLARSEILKQLRWLTLEDNAGSPPSADTEPPAVDPETIALLQYTSGSTDTPKGVMVTHANLIHNSGIITRRFLQTENSRTVFWLPLSHDMGLVGGVFQPLYVGFPGTFMPPLSFLQRPTRWLHAISACGATTSAAPNFAYDMCVRKTTPAQRESLDLSAWTVAINGAEPVGAHTIESFSEFFGPCGFRRESFCPSYGLAEATLVVSGEKRILPPTIVKESTLGSANPSDAAAVVGCGGVAQEQTVVIVHPELRCRCKPGEVGEIWVAGDSVARGYWNRIEETETTFGGYLSDSGDGPFLRTGDLGYLFNGELFIAGRLKDVIIVRGVNYSPYSLEQTIERCHPSLRLSCGAAFVVQAGDGERLVVVHELERNFLRTVPEQEVFNAIRQAVSEEHGLEVHGIVLLRTASLPKTVTNKTKRHMSREAYLNGTLNAVAQWSSPETGPVAVYNAPVEPVPAAGRGREETVRLWLMEKLSRQLNIPTREMDVRRPFAEYGFDSAAVVELAGDLEDYLGCELSPTLVYDYPTVESLCQYLAHAPRASDIGEQKKSHVWNP